MFLFTPWVLAEVIHGTHRRIRTHAHTYARTRTQTHTSAPAKFVLYRFRRSAPAAFVLYHFRRNAPADFVLYHFPWKGGRLLSNVVKYKLVTTFGSEIEGGCFRLFQQKGFWCLALDYNLFGYFCRGGFGVWSWITATSCISAVWYLARTGFPEAFPRVQTS